MDSSQRKYPYKKPAGHVPPIPRWQIEFKSPWTALHVVYLGIQCHDAAGRAACEALAVAIPQALSLPRCPKGTLAAGRAPLRST